MTPKALQAAMDELVGHEADSGAPSRCMPDGLYKATEAASYLAMSTKQLRGHVHDGAIRFIVTGRGDRRPRIAFARSDLDEFIERRARVQPCPSTSRRVRPSTSTIFGTAVIDFSARQRPPTSAKPNR